MHTAECAQDAMSGAGGGRERERERERESEREHAHAREREERERERRPPVLPSRCPPYRCRLQRTCAVTDTKLQLTSLKLHHTTTRN